MQSTRSYLTSLWISRPSCYWKTIFHENVPFSSPTDETQIALYFLFSKNVYTTALENSVLPPRTVQTCLLSEVMKIKSPREQKTSMFTIYHKILVLPKMSSSPIMQPIACADANWPSPQHPVRDRAQYTTMICRHSGCYYFYNFVPDLEVSCLLLKCPHEIVTG